MIMRIWASDFTKRAVIWASFGIDGSSCEAIVKLVRCGSTTLDIYKIKAALRRNSEKWPIGGGFNRESNPSVPGRVGVVGRRVGEPAKVCRGSRDFSRRHADCW